VKIRRAGGEAITYINGFQQGKTTLLSLENNERCAEASARTSIARFQMGSTRTECHVITCSIKINIPP
jgi:hypothetical protein